MPIGVKPPRIARGLVVVFLGPVGVGKTTVIAELTRSLDRLGVRTRRTFIKAFHGPSYALWALATRLLGLQGDLAPWFIIPRLGYTSLARVLVLVSAYLDALISLPAKVMASYLLKLMGFTILSEEFVHSTIYDYLYSYIGLNVRQNPFTLLPLAAMYRLTVAYRPDLVVFLDADDRNLLDRWSVRGYGDPQPRYVRAQRRLLKAILGGVPGGGGILYVNTSNASVSEVTARVLRAILKLRSGSLEQI